MRASEPVAIHLVGDDGLQGVVEEVDVVHPYPVVRDVGSSDDESSVEREEGGKDAHECSCDFSIRHCEREEDHEGHGETGVDEDHPREEEEVGGRCLESREPVAEDAEDNACDEGDGKFGGDD